MLMHYFEILALFFLYVFLVFYSPMKKKTLHHTGSTCTTTADRSIVREVTAPTEGDLFLDFNEHWTHILKEQIQVIWTIQK